MKINDDISRREFISRKAKTLLGLSTFSFGSSQNLLGSTSTVKTKAKSIIYLFMRGGMSHIDTFDLKLKNREVQGPTQGIKTSESGLYITDKLPKLAKHMNKFAQIRSMHHTQGNHEPGTYYMMTGYTQETGVIVHPAIGSWISKQTEKLNQNLPKYVRSGSLAGHPANGFLDVKHAPLPISKPSAGLQNSALLEQMTPQSFNKSLDLAKALDQQFLAKYNSKQLNAYGDLYKEAIAMMNSSDLEVFDISNEPGNIKKMYGSQTFGQACLLARKLVEKGVRFVEVDLAGWDTHTDNHVGVAKMCQILDEGLSALMSDLKQRGLLDSTLVVLTTEFGRTPFIDEYRGRSHNPLGFTTLLAGGGVNGGTIYGKTDQNGKSAIENPVSALDLNSTLAWALGLNYSKYESAFTGSQKFSISGKDTGKKGKVIKQIFT